MITCPSCPMKSNLLNDLKPLLALMDSIRLGSFNAVYITHRIKDFDDYIE